MALQQKVVVRCPDGLHARPALKLAELARKFSSSVVITREGRMVDGKSILDLLTLAAEPGVELILDVDGPDEKEALQAVAGFLEASSMQNGGGGGD